MGESITTTTLTLTEDIWVEVTAALDLPVESAAVLTARVVRNGPTELLLVRQLHWVPENHYLVREPMTLSIASEGYVPALGVAADDDALAIFMHTHPDGSPSPSSYDDQVDRDLGAVFGRRTRTDRYVSLIIGGTIDDPRFTCRMYGADSSEPALVSRIRVVGTRRLRVIAADGGAANEDSLKRTTFDRQIRAFGVEGQALLKSLRVGVVGAGGTGSAVLEQLVRLGVGDVVLIDDDVIDEHNVSRIHESRASDRGRPKVAVLAERSVGIGLGPVVRPVQERLRTADVTRQLVDRDLIFGCTDDDFGRAVLSRLAYWYLIPVVDIGFVVDAAGGTIRELFGRVTLVGPGSSCLICRGRVSSQRVAWESLPENERRVRIQEGYVPQLGEPAPSVVAYTTLVASLAVNEMLARVIGYGDDDPPGELLVRLAERSISRNVHPPDPDHYCGDRSYWGRGDEQPMLGWIWQA